MPPVYSEFMCYCGLSFSCSDTLTDFPYLLSSQDALAMTFSPRKFTRRYRLF